ncbi:MAG: DUF6788 family protein [Acidobacteriota bacterium]
MQKENAAESLWRRYRKLALKLSATGLILQGTITERVITRKASKGKKEEQRYGPYYQWTYKSAGTTVTANLTAKQAKLFGKAIENNRKAEAILSEMRALSRQLCEAAAEGVKKRTRRKPVAKP